MVNCGSTQFRDNYLVKNMQFSEYQETSRKTALYPDLGKNFIYPTLGLVGEAGEVAEKMKKVLRDKNGILDEPTRIELQKELGDVLWYLTQLAVELGMTLEQVAEKNIEKLQSRQQRNQLHGDGDNR